MRRRLDGFWPDAADLPAERINVPWEQRERAALIVLAIGRMFTPEDVVAGTAALEILSAFDDELEREEALAHVDLLLSVLLPRTGRMSAATKPANSALSGSYDESLKRLLWKPHEPTGLGHDDLQGET